MNEKSLLTIFKEEREYFRRINFMLMNGVNILGDNMPKEYNFLEENFVQLAEYYNTLGYTLEKQDNFFYIRVLIKDRFTPISYFSKAETFTGMLLASKYFTSLENPQINTEALFEELKMLFSTENLYEIYVRKMSSFVESEKRLETIQDNYYKTLKELIFYNFIELKSGTLSRNENSLIEIKKPIKRFFDLALALYDKDEENIPIEDLLNIFIKDTEFVIDSDEQMDEE
ncbi:condensin complex protein MksE [Calditerrivibrio nitroreducens]|uniref:Uncharacterized protein n=1 Tax=Calditerrivibrio nitroreducens (strain DSM 19672 / NBRC 101217 / Yu37-1) TaxID=768670 RepID=E4TFQ5_CALNY|nr:hypothetical protein [Calditerrivibrio nitroreducens]ADR18523.1 hypothetical protein Calni_0611 [Calditerrivibrio nitroreducens DSM 19672]